MTIVRGMTCTLVVTVLLASTSDPVAAESTKASRACRKTIGAKLSKVVSTGFSVVDACQKNRDKGKFAGDCNDLAQADVKAKLTKAEASATKGIAKKCFPGDPVLGNYDLGNSANAFFPTAQDAVEASGAALLGSPDLQGDKAKLKCHAQISKTALKDVNEILKTAIKCQNTLDKVAVSFGELAADCVAIAAKAGPTGEAAIVKKCTGLTGADVGSCSPLPTCATTAATATGQALVAAIFGQPTPGCGNSIVDAGEECDDGNAVSTDGCIDCKLATCGDGFVHAGVELCGDVPADACSAPSVNTCQVPPCVPSGTTRQVTVKFTKPASQTVAGLLIALDYPETQVRIPGTGSDGQVTGRVTVIPSGISAITDSDYDLQVAVTSIAIDPGDFFTVQFDDCEAVTAPTLDEFACNVLEASNDQTPPAIITSQVHCTVTAP